MKMGIWFCMVLLCRFVRPGRGVLPHGDNSPRVAMLQAARTGLWSLDGRARHVGEAFTLNAGSPGFYKGVGSTSRALQRRCCIPPTPDGRQRISGELGDFETSFADQLTNLRAWMLQGSSSAKAQRLTPGTQDWRRSPNAWNTQLDDRDLFKPPNPWDGCRADVENLSLETERFARTRM